jgi:hypothetical protein
LIHFTLTIFDSFFIQDKYWKPLLQFFKIHAPALDLLINGAIAALIAAVSLFCNSSKFNLFCKLFFSSSKSAYLPCSQAFLNASIEALVNVFSALRPIRIS